MGSGRRKSFRPRGGRARRPRLGPTAAAAADPARSLRPSRSPHPPPPPLSPPPADARCERATQRPKSSCPSGQPLERTRLTRSWRAVRPRRSFPGSRTRCRRVRGRGRPEGGRGGGEGSRSGGGGRFRGREGGRAARGRCSAGRRTVSDVLGGVVAARTAVSLRSRRLTTTTKRRRLPPGWPSPAAPVFRCRVAGARPMRRRGLCASSAWQL